MTLGFELARILLIAICVLSATARANADESVFLKPVRLQADGKDIDTGDVWGHSGPCVADVDGDGLRDLVVGSFDGKFRFYKNIGSTKEPKYAAFTFLKAGDEDAKVKIYCCIGSSPFFVDFDNDGKLDFLSGSYDPGECYLFRGLGSGNFAARETLVDKSGKPILRHPEQRQTVESFGSWPVTVDWNNDGKLDLLIGSFDGTMFVRLNEGTRDKPAFAATSIVVQAAGKDLQLPSEDGAGHAPPTVADWDRDGRWDILAGCDNGGVYFYRNIGEPGAPRFDKPEVLIAPHQGSGFSEILEVGGDPIPGIRTQVFAVDYFGNGNTDLLVGDFCSTVKPRADLTPAERQEFKSLRKQSYDAFVAQCKQVDDLRADFAKRFPGDAINSDEANAEWSKAYQALQNGEQYKASKKREEELEAAIGEFLVHPPQPGRIDKFSTTRGYVWLFQRK